MTEQKNPNLEIELQAQSSNNFPILAPRRGSLSIDYNRPSPRTPKFPLHSPTTPNSPEKISHLSFSPQLETFAELEEISESLDNLLKKRNTSNKILVQKERDLQRLENEKQIWLKEKAELEKSQNKQNQLLTIQNEELNRLKREIKESNDDFYQLDEKNQELSYILQQERSLNSSLKLTNRQLESKLAQEIDENCRLKENQEQNNTNLLAKIEELTKLKKLNQQERQEWQNTILVQTEQYEQEKSKREKKFTRQMENLRTFQTNEPLINPIKERLTHNRSHSFSSPNSPRNSYILEDDRIIFPASSPKRNDFQAELYRSGHGEKSGVISKNFTNSPQTEENNPFERPFSPKNKKHSNSPLFIRSDSPATENTADTAENNDAYEDLLNTLVQETEDSQGQLLTENQSLKGELTKLQDNQGQLELAYKTLFDEKVEQERVLQSFNEKELAWEAEKRKYERLLQEAQQEKLIQLNNQQKTNEELAETQYLLAQADSKKKQVDKLRKREHYQLKTQHQSEITEWQDISAELADELQSKDNEINDKETIAEKNLARVKKVVNEVDLELEKTEQSNQILQNMILDIRKKFFNK